MVNLKDKDRRKILSALAMALAGSAVGIDRTVAQNATSGEQDEPKKGKNDTGVVSVKNTPSREWGRGGMTWELLANPELAVFYEKVSPGTMEVNHYHVNACQFFFVIRGQLTIKLSNEEVILNELEGFEVKPGVPHQAINKSNDEIEFLAISSPITTGDRVIV